MNKLMHYANDFLFTKMMDTPSLAWQPIPHLVDNLGKAEVKASTRVCLQGILHFLEPQVVVTDLHAKYMLRAILISMHPADTLHNEQDRYADLVAAATKASNQFYRMLQIAIVRYDPGNDKEPCLVQEGQGFVDHLADFITLFRTWEKQRRIQEINQDLDSLLRMLYTSYQDREIDTADVFYIQIKNAIKELRNELLHHAGLQAVMHFDAQLGRVAAEHREFCLLRQEQRRNLEEGFDLIMM